MNSNDNLFKLYNDGVVKSEEDIYIVLDEIRESVMFKSREECLHIISTVLYAYGVKEGRLKEPALEHLLFQYRENFSDTDLERIAALCLNINAAKQIKEEFNNELKENENGN